MVSRRKAKRAKIYDVWENCFIHGTGEPVGFWEPWYIPQRKEVWRKHWAGEVESMTGCVKRSVQNRRGKGGSWNGRTVDPWYGRGLISWKD
jgi:hypothetical protein